MNWEKLEPKLLAMAHLLPFVLLVIFILIYVSANDRLLEAFASRQTGHYMASVHTAEENAPRLPGASR